MKVVHVETIFARGEFAISAEWKKLFHSILNAILSIDWPVGSGRFTIFEQSGKKRGEGNGVKPIKTRFVQELCSNGWQAEKRLDILDGARPGPLDAIWKSSAGYVALEWETGNISSTHRALNKMAIGLMRRNLVGAVLILPSRKLYKFLTDRVGNYDEIVPYLDLWRNVKIENGIFEIIVIEHDASSTDVSRIPKGTDGRALA